MLLLEVSNSQRISATVCELHKKSLIQFRKKNGEIKADPILVIVSRTVPCSSNFET